ncbi:MAG: hypothetical protein MZW92_06530 [Comamonadaceae bacterium]|nr:hypothetical protein [Comamonadaceae bacterium]
MGDMTEVGLEILAVRVLVQNPVGDGVEIEKPRAHVREKLVCAVLVTPEVLHPREAVEDIPCACGDIVFGGCEDAGELLDILRVADADRPDVSFPVVILQERRVVLSLARREAVDEDEVFRCQVRCDLVDDALGDLLKLTYMTFWDSLLDWRTKFLMNMS